MDIWQYNPDGIAFNNSTGAYDIDMPPGKYIIQIGKKIIPAFSKYSSNKKLGLFDCSISSEIIRSTFIF